MGAYTYTYESTITRVVLVFRGERIWEQKVDFCGPVEDLCRARADAEEVAQVLEAYAKAGEPR